jgi:hypothetical protein
MVTTYLIGSRNCPTMGCNKPLTLNFTTSFLNKVFGGNALFLCFMFDQTKSYCREGARWAEEYGGCPYWQRKIHWIIRKPESPPGNTLEVYYDDPKCHLTIPDPWHDRWATGVIAKGYAHGTASYPSTTFKIRRDYEQMVPMILGVLKDQAKAIKEAENSLQNKTHRDPISWLSLVQKGANLLSRSGLANVTKCFLCAALSRLPLIAVPLPGPFPLNVSAFCLCSPPSQGPFYIEILHPHSYPSTTLILAKYATLLTLPYRAPSGPLQEASFGVMAHFQKTSPN